MTKSAAQKSPARQSGGGEARPPVVAVLGHIDHGKSTLVDCIKKTNITASEAGGITQHVGAYEVRHRTKDGRETMITLLDTPGHEAFSGIRTRSTTLADMAILVVSAEDGVKPQTEEVIKYIRESSLPFIVALTKVDKPTADIARAKQSLAENEIYVEGYGGDTSVVDVSGKTGKGVDELLDMISLMSEINAKVATRDVLGSGVIIETRRDAKRGVIAVGIIQNGTLSTGLFAASRGAVAPVRFLLDSEGNQVESLSFSSPVQIAGWDEMPEIGAEFKTFLKKEEALEYAKTEKKTAAPKTADKTSENMTLLPLVIKADTAGSLEAVLGEISGLARERIAPKIIFSGLGGINENDIKLALSGSRATIFGFNVKTEAKAGLLAERSGVPIFDFNIIYEFVDKVKALLAEKEPRIEVEETEGRAKVLKLFDASKGKQILGARVLEGQIKRGAQIKILRREIELGRGRIKELQQSKIAAEMVNEGIEFGAMVESKFEIAPGDTLEAINLVTK
ncbi:MAG: translation initiation factor IF-2 [Minisyncoccia bacterium]